MKADGQYLKLIAVETLLSRFSLLIEISGISTILILSIDL
jgi:hypothetical protein